jgi:hypothetical protein
MYRLFIFAKAGEVKVAASFWQSPVDLAVQPGLS